MLKTLPLEQLVGISLNTKLEKEPIWMPTQIYFISKNIPEIENAPFFDSNDFLGKTKFMMATLILTVNQTNIMYYKVIPLSVMLPLNIPTTLLHT